MINEIKRSDAGRLIEAIAVWAAAKDEQRIMSILKEHGIEAPVECNGEAHDPEVGGQIDHCGLCAPHWGWKFRSVKVK